MTTNTVKLDAKIGNRAFVAFIFTIVGYTLMVVWCIQMGAGLAGHAVIGLVSLALSAVAFRHARLYWPALTQGGRPKDQLKLALALNKFDAAWCLLLLAIGFLVTWLLVAGWIAPFAIFAVSLSLVPWLKLAFCRRHAFASCMLIEVGALGGLLTVHASTDPMLLPIAGWVLWVIASIALLHNIYARAFRSAALASTSGQTNLDHLEKID